MISIKKLVYVWIAFSLIGGANLHVFAQNNTITLEEENKIRANARATLEDYAGFLNHILTMESGPALEKTINNSLLGSRKLFAHDSVAIEYDLDPIHYNESTKENSPPRKVRNYLFKLQGVYVNAEPGIVFSDIKISKIIYTADSIPRVKALYQVYFAGNSKIPSRRGKKYIKSSRVADIKISYDETLGIWKTRISSIIFERQGDKTEYYPVLSFQEQTKQSRQQLEIAQKFWRIYEYDSALIAYREANSILPDDSINQKIRNIQSRLQVIGTREKFSGGRVDNYSSNIAEERGNPDLHFERGSIYLKKNDLDNAQRDFEKVLELTKGNYRRALILLASVFERKKLYQKSVNCLKDALDLNEDLPGLKNITWQEIILRDWDAAEEHLTKILLLQPGANAHKELAGVYVKQSREERAITEYKKAFVYDRDDPDIHYSIAEVFLSFNTKSRIDSAVNYFNAALGIDSFLIKRESIAEKFLGKADEFASESDTSLALRCIEKALDFDPNNTKAQDLRDKLDPPADAAIIAEPTPTRGETNVTITDTPIPTPTKEISEDLSDELKADSLIKSSQFQDAIDLLFLQESKTRDRPDTKVKLSRCYAKIGDYRASLKYAKAALKIDKKSVKANVLAGQALVSFKNGESNGAGDYFRAALRVNPNDAEACRGYGTFLQEIMGKDKKAQEYFNRAKMLDSLQQ